jgi:hypothetical protein
VARLAHTDAGYEELRRSAEKLSTLGVAAQRALATAEEVHGVNAIFLGPQRIAIGVFVIGIALLMRVPIAVVVLFAVVALVVGYRWYAGFRATEASLAKLRLFGLHGRTFLRSTEGERA